MIHQYRRCICIDLIAILGQQHDMKIQHLHLPGLTPYLHAAHIQDRLVRAILDSKASATISSTSSIPKPSPLPTILTFTPPPTYTCGRREISHLSSSQITHLRTEGRAEFHEALRGGQTTYHGPGQVVGYPIIDLKAHKLSARCYVHLLEESVVGLCERFGIEGIRTQDPGVWTKRSNGNEKIGALGVHLRRNVTAHGVGFNIGEQVMWWFGRIVACGLEGKGATCLEREGINVADLEEGQVGRMFVEEMAKRLHGVDEIVSIPENELPI